jgi:hypothetical protein
MPAIGATVEYVGKRRTLRMTVKGHTTSDRGRPVVVCVDADGTERNFAPSALNVIAGPNATAAAAKSAAAAAPAPKTTGRLFLEAAARHMGVDTAAGDTALIAAINLALASKGSNVFVGLNGAPARK